MPKLVSSSSGGCRGLAGTGLGSPRWATHHIDELRDGEPEFHDDHVGGVGHRPGPSVVAGEEVLEEALLRVAAGLLLRRGCCKEMGLGAG